jgi:hypothetical protein
LTFLRKQKSKEYLINKNHFKNTFTKMMLRVVILFLSAAATCFAFDCPMEGLYDGKFRMRSRSECRCYYAMQFGFTDAPPFNGQEVELHFSKDYSESELNETVQNLKGFVLQFDSCYDIDRRREQTKRECEKQYENQERQWKEQVLSMKVEEKCVKEKVALAERNAAKWFYQEPENPRWNSQYDLCPKNPRWNSQYDLCQLQRMIGKDGDLLLEHACVEADCLRNGGKPIREEITHYQRHDQSMSCVNKIKLKIV